MTQWRPTAALTRGVVVGTLGLAAAVVAGEPVILVLIAPILLVAALGLMHRPTRQPQVATSLDHRVLHEGQGTVSRLLLTGAGDVEHATRVLAPAPHLALLPASGVLAGRGADHPPQLGVSPRRWGRRPLGEEKVALHSGWGGYVWGPVTLGGSELRVLPVATPFDSRAEAPLPDGLVGAHRARRSGGGVEFSDIRPFQPGDRLRRISWRVSLRTDALHVQTARAEEDSAVLLLVDAVADHGRSGGLDGEASSLDLTVRAAAAIAEHHVRRGDRVALRVVGRRHERVPFGSGRRHLRRLLASLAELRVGEPDGGGPDTLPVRATAGTVVIVLSPMLSDRIATVTASLVRRGLPVMVVDTLPAEVGVPPSADHDPGLARLAWRMRAIERDQVLARLARIGCPVVAWRGPGTLDEVLHRLARRARMPRVRTR